MGPVFGMFLGLTLSWGLILVWQQLRARKITLKQRLAPYLVEADQHTRIMGPSPVHTPQEVLAKLIAPWFASLSAGLAKLGSTNSQTARKLALAGRDTAVEEYRLEQIAWACAGLIVGLIAASSLAIQKGTHPLTLVLIIGLATVIGPVLSDHLLALQSKQRTQRLLMEFPTIAELLALAVSAGESPVAALERVAGTSKGELSRELGLTLRQVRAGTPIHVAMLELGQRTEVPTIMRFADAISVAIERGTPLAAVLQAQAQDARDAGHVELMEVGGAKELRMLFPVVFLILPITVLFAAFPSIVAFNVGF